jgi:hypothetical protein
MTTIKLGEGVLNWHRFERQTDRYGSVHLDGHTDESVSMAAAPVGTRGDLVATILKTRHSGHIGDLFRGIGPSTPTVGEEITLGTGTLFVETSDSLDSIGVKPDDDREYDWLNPEALYRCHNQTVRLELRPEVAQ